jgi:hypothetical protein
MAENTDATAPAVAKAAQKRDLVAVEWLTELQLASDVATAAQVVGRADALAEQDVSAGFVADLLERITAAGELVTSITTARTGTKGATRGEGEAKAALLAAAGAIQSGARRKFARTAPERLALYGCGGGKDLVGMNRAKLSAAIPTLITTAKADGLSGTADAKTNAVQSAFDAWNNFDATQTASGSAETTARAALKTLLLGADGKGATGIAADRRTIQYAADAAWPPGSDVAVRREFKLQPKRRFAG